MTRVCLENDCAEPRYGRYARCIHHRNVRVRLDPVGVRNRHLKWRYGITVDDYDCMFEEQGGVCAICDCEQTDKRLFIDHDHKTGAVRGLLCRRCNSALERLEKFPGWTGRAENYLEATGSRA